MVVYDLHLNMLYRSGLHTQAPCAWSSPSNGGGSILAIQTISCTTYFSLYLPWTTYDRASTLLNTSSYIYKAHIQLEILFAFAGFAFNMNHLSSSLRHYPDSECPEGFSSVTSWARRTSI